MNFKRNNTVRVEDLGINGRIILKWNFDIEWEGLDLIHLVQDRDQ